MAKENKRVVSDEDKIERFVPGSKLPDLWVIFDTRGEAVGQIANKCITLDTQTIHYPNTKRIASGLGKLREMEWYTAMAAPVDVQRAVQVFEDEGYITEKADEADFRELQAELDKLLTIEDDSMDKQNAERTAKTRTDQ